ncbi:unnamed protein product, partial [Polarella glacialis]
DLPRLVTSYVTVRCGSRLLFNELVHRCTQASATFKPDALASLVAAFSKSPHKPKMFLIAFGPVVSANLPHFSQEQLGRVVEAYASLVSVDENSPGEVVNIAELFKGKKGVLFAVPGAFTPTCVVECVSVNDPFVMMKAWGKQQETEGKVRMLIDTRCELTKALGMELPVEAMLGSTRFAPTILAALKA